MGIDWSATRRHPRLAGTLAGFLLALGCGGSGAGAGFSSPDGGSGAPASDGGDTSSDDSSTLFLDSGQFTTVLASSDGAAPPVTFACEPGTYSGMFTTTVTTDAGLFPSLLSFNWTGTLSIALVGHVTQTQSANGENFTVAAPVLTIAPGAMLSGADNFGGHFISGLSGQLDCPTKMLTGTLSNGVYEYPGDAGSIVMQGTLSGTYDGTKPPTLTMGEIQVGSPTYSTLGATGTWSATLQ
jgi:hypothetical protein